MIHWKPIAEMPPEFKDGREVLLWLRAPYSQFVVRCWSKLWGGWLEPGYSEEEAEGCTGCLVPIAYAEVTPPEFAAAAEAALAA